MTHAAVYPASHNLTMPSRALPQDETMNHLILAAHQGDSQAFEELLSRFRYRLRMLVRAFFCVGFERDDFLQEANLGFARAVQDYELGKGAFPAFVDLCVRRHLISYLRSLRRKKHMLLNRSYSLDAPLNSGSEDDARTWYDRLGTAEALEWIECQDHQAFLEALAQRCSPFENAVLKKYGQGYSYQEVAIQCGTRSKSIDNALTRIKKKAKHLLEEQPHFMQRIGRGFSQ